MLLVRLATAICGGWAVLRTSGQAIEGLRWKQIRQQKSLLYEWRDFEDNFNVHFHRPTAACL